MDKLLLLSALVMMVVVPLRAARLADPARSLRRAVGRFFAFNVAYWFAVLFVWFGLLKRSDPSRLLHLVNGP